MRIALDYDGTYTLDPAFWAAMISRARISGHHVNIVTMRRPDEPIEVTDIMGADVHVIYTSRKAKVPFCLDSGIWVDVWIDDSPHWLLQDSL